MMETAKAMITMMTMIATAAAPGVAVVTLSTVVVGDAHENGCCGHADDVDDDDDDDVGFSGGEEMDGLCGGRYRELCSQIYLKGHIPEPSSFYRGRLKTYGLSVGGVPARLLRKTDSDL